VILIYGSFRKVLLAKKSKVEDLLYKGETLKKYLALHSGGKQAAEQPAENQMTWLPQPSIEFFYCTIRQSNTVQRLRLSSLPPRFS
jgi:hypothetical protein